MPVNSDECVDIQLRDAERIIDVMTMTAEIEGTLDEKVDFKLRSLLDLLERPHTMTSLLLIESFLNRNKLTVPLRWTYAGRDDLQPIFDDDELEEGMRAVGAVFDVILPRVTRSPRVPQVMVCGEDTKDKDWVANIYRPRMTDEGFQDVLLGAWSAIEDRLITLSVMQLPDDPPFTESDRTLLSLMLRAIAPFVDREVLRYETALARHDLTDRQREVLLLLLSGDSEKEVAKRIHRSVHTVHTFVKQLYERFGVSSRGELMAHFIDQSVSRLAKEYVTQLEESPAGGDGKNQR